MRICRSGKDGSDLVLGTTPRAKPGVILPHTFCSLPMASAVRRALPALIVFDLDACLWTPEMFELDSAPTSYSASKGGVQAGSDTVRLFPGAASVLRRILTNEGGAFTGVKVAVASSTTEPSYAQRCLEQLPIFEDGSRAEKVNDMVDYRQIYPGSKGRQHFPALQRQTNIPFASMLFFDDCTYGDNCADVARACDGTTCVRTPSGLTEELFDAGLAAWADGKHNTLAPKYNQSSSSSSSSSSAAACARSAANPPVL